MTRETTEKVSRPRRLLVNSISIAVGADGNVRLDTVHKGGLVREGVVTIERADVADVIRALELAVAHGWVR